MKLDPKQRQILEALDKPNWGLPLQEKTGIGLRIYGILRDLEERGLLRSWSDSEVVPERMGHPRRYYVITPEGRYALQC